MIKSTLSSFPNSIEYDTVYPATSNLTGAFVGVADVLRYVNDGVRDCPDQKYALLGYSQGASVNNIALRNITDTDSAAYKAIVAVLVIGNPGHISGEKANVDQYGGNSTRDYNGWVLLDDNHGAIPQQYYADQKVLDICYTGDTVCAVPRNVTGGVSPPHLLYGNTSMVQTMGGEFLIEKLDKGSPSLNSTVAISSNCTSAPASSTSTEVYTGGAALKSPASGLLIGAMLGVTIMGLAF